MEVTRPDMLFKNIGEPEAAICFSIFALNLGFANFNNALFRTKGIIATTEQAHIESETASADPTTSISHTSKKKVKRPIVSKLEQIFITMMLMLEALLEVEAK